LTPGMAATTSDFVRNNPGLSPDSTAATMTMAQMRDYPGIAEIVRADYHGQGLLMRTLNNTVGRVTRPVTAGFYDIWDQSITRWQRFAVQQYQNPEKGWAVNLGRAGTGIAGQAVVTDTSVGDILGGGAIGTGLIAGRPDDPMMMPGAGKHFENQLKQDVGFDEAISNTEEWVAEKYKTNLVSDAWAVADATRLHVTVDGIEYGYGVSAGRLATTPLFQLGYVTPHTIPANIISGSIDFYTQIALDPMDPGFAQLTRWFSVRKALRPQGLSSVDEVIAAHGGVLLTEREMKGIYHGENAIGGPSARTTGMMADDYIFFGGPEFDPVTGHQGGGMSHDLDRAIGYAKTRGGDTPAVYAVKKSDLPNDVIEYIEKVGEVEQLVVHDPTDLELTQIDDLVMRLERDEVLASQAETDLKQFVEGLESDSPEFTAYMDQRREYQAAEEAGTLEMDDLGFPIELLDDRRIRRTSSRRFTLPLCPTTSDTGWGSGFQSSSHPNSLPRHGRQLSNLGCRSMLPRTCWLTAISILVAKLPARPLVTSSIMNSVLSSRMVAGRRRLQTSGLLTARATSSPVGSLTLLCR